MNDGEAKTLSRRNLKRKLNSSEVDEEENAAPTRTKFSAETHRYFYPTGPIIQLLVLECRYEREHVEGRVEGQAVIFMLDGTRSKNCR